MIRANWPESKQQEQPNKETPPNVLPMFEPRSELREPQQHKKVHRRMPRMRSCYLGGGSYITARRHRVSVSRTLTIGTPRPFFRNTSHQALNICRYTNKCKETGMDLRSWLEFDVLDILPNHKKGGHHLVHLFIGKVQSDLQKIAADK